MIGAFFNIVLFLELEFWDGVSAVGLVSICNWMEEYLVWFCNTSNFVCFRNSWRAALLSRGA
jgi:hypothetical protein